MLAVSALIELQTCGFDHWKADFLKIMLKKFDHFRSQTSDTVAFLVKL
jgi:hypothetical protein